MSKKERKKETWGSFEMRFKLFPGRRDPESNDFFLPGVKFNLVSSLLEVSSANSALSHLRSRRYTVASSTDRTLNHFSPSDWLRWTLFISAEDRITPSVYLTLLLLQATSPSSGPAIAGDQFHEF